MPHITWNQNATSLLIIYSLFFLTLCTLIISKLHEYLNINMGSKMIVKYIDYSKHVGFLLFKLLADPIPPSVILCHLFHPPPKPHWESSNFWIGDSMQICRWWNHFHKRQCDWKCSTTFCMVTWFSFFLRKNCNFRKLWLI